MNGPVVLGRQSTPNVYGRAESSKAPNHNPPSFLPKELIDIVMKCDGRKEEVGKRKEEVEKREEAVGMREEEVGRREAAAEMREGLLEQRETSHILCHMTHLQCLSLGIFTILVVSIAGVIYLFTKEYSSELPSTTEQPVLSESTSQQLVSTVPTVSLSSTSQPIQYEYKPRVPEEMISKGCEILKEFSLGNVNEGTYLRSYNRGELSNAYYSYHVNETTLNVAKYCDYNEMPSCIYIANYYAYGIKFFLSDNKECSIRQDVV